MASDERWRAAGMLRLPHDETDESKRYTMPHPDALATNYGAVRSKLYPCVRLEDLPETVTLGRVELEHVLRLAGGYLDLTTYQLGQEHCVEKLRDIWRARKAGA